MANSCFEEICVGGAWESAEEEFSSFTDVDRAEQAQKNNATRHKNTRLKRLIILRIFSPYPRKISASSEQGAIRAFADSVRTIAYFTKFLN